MDDGHEICLSWTSQDVYNMQKEGLNWPTLEAVTAVAP